MWKWTIRTVGALVTGSRVLHLSYLASGADPDRGEDSHDLPATFPAFHRGVEVVTFVIRVLRLLGRVPAGESQLPDNQAGSVMRVIRPRMDALQERSQALYRLGAHRRRRAAVAAVLGPAALHGLPGRVAVTVPFLVSRLFAVILGALLGRHLQQWWERAEVVDPRQPTSAAGFSCLQLGPGEVCAFIVPTLALISLPPSVLLGLLRPAAGSLECLFLRCGRDRAGQLLPTRRHGRYANFTRMISHAFRGSLA